MRNIGWLEIVVVVAVLLIFWPGLWRILGRKARPGYLHLKWLWSSHFGSAEEAVTAEAELGRHMMQQFRESGTVCQEKGAGPLGEIGKRLERAGDSRRRYHYEVSQGSVNAAALPGGYIVVSAELMALVGNDADCLAFVLAHEMGHIEEEHALQRATLVALSRVLTRGMVATAFVRGYSRDNEYDADEFAVRLMHRAGFRADGARRTLEALARLSSREVVPEWWSTHPEPKSRIRRIEDLVKQLCETSG